MDYDDFQDEQDTEMDYCYGCGEPFRKDELHRCNGQLVCDACMREEMGGLIWTNF